MAAVHENGGLVRVVIGPYDAAAGHRCVRIDRFVVVGRDVGGGVTDGTGHWAPRLLVAWASVLACDHRRRRGTALVGTARAGVSRSRAHGARQRTVRSAVGL